jgi:hypothetical protein
MKITQLLGEVFLTNERLIWYKESSGLKCAVQVSHCAEFLGFG